jgi:dihydrofolate reductase
LRKVVLYISLSLDGYIADVGGDVGWLGGQDPDYTGDYGYEAFICTADTVLMGARTYRQVTEELSPDCWPYQGLETYILTHRPEPDTPERRFVDGSPTELLRRLRQEEGGNIWICGGADLIRQCMGEIDEFHLSIMPILLGNGTPLFPEGGPPLTLRLTDLRQENGVIDCVYQRR